MDRVFSYEAALIIASRKSVMTALTKRVYTPCSANVADITEDVGKLT